MVCKRLAVTTSIAIALGASGWARADLVVNGNFSQFTDTSGNAVTTGGQLGYNRSLVGWTNAPYSGSTPGYNFIFASDKDATTGVGGDAGNLALWGPGNGSANGLTASPAGGAFLGADGAYQQSIIYQQINGLVAGRRYDVGFWWAGAQQYGFTGVNTEQWNVYFGSSPSTYQEQSTAVLTNSSEGFTGWRHVDFIFTADGASDYLGFLAVGTANGSPNSVPPFSLLDGVTVNAVPEPSSVLLLGLGLGGLVAARARRRRATDAGEPAAGEPAAA